MQNSKIARATHNVAAWRIWDDSKGVQLHDNDDDGENFFLAMPCPLQQRSIASR